MHSSRSIGSKTRQGAKKVCYKTKQTDIRVYGSKHNNLIIITLRGYSHHPGSLPFHPLEQKQAELKEKEVVMQIVAFKREQEQHRLHIKRIRETRPMLDSSTPESLGLKHLAFRPKKQQLIEDQRQRVAKENAKLMSGMTKIMNERRAQLKHVPPPSLNEVQRKKEVDRMNFENNLMLQRLNKISPTLSKSQLEEDFQRHLKAEANLRRRQMKPLALPKDMHRVNERSTMFDASTYASQHDSFGGGGSSVLQQEFDGPIQSMSEFRQQVIASKKAAHLQSTGTAAGFPGGVGSGTLSNAGANTIMKSQREISVHRNEPLFELSHGPS